MTGKINNKRTKGKKMKRNQRNFSGVASELHEKLKLEGSKLKA